MGSLYGLQSAVIYGGTEKDDQIRTLLLTKPHIIVATPGRLLDILSMPHDKINLDLSAIQSVVLDEADKLLNLGFEEQVNRILAALPLKRRSLLFSATFPSSVASACDRWLTDPVHVKIGGGVEGASTLEAASAGSLHENITQVVHVLGEHKKPRKLIKFVEQVAAKDEGKRIHSRILIFVKNSKTAEYLKTFISEKAGKKRKRGGGMVMMTTIR
jgi:ATP-dependent RNA helicase RhlE